MLGADRSVGTKRGRSRQYYLLQPFFRLLVKSPTAALQSVLHVLFLTTPFKSTPKSRPNSKKSPTEEDAVLPEEIWSCEDKEKDGELGGEVTGRLVWESFEKALNEWEDANPDPNTTTGKSGGRSGTPPEVDMDGDRDGDWAGGFGYIARMDISYMHIQQQISIELRYVLSFQG
ncbi:hypothetical protein PILCRDRAFT_12644 [Piloderma croceum F 1598]|uniref:Uncharacterized protein n=1 Tax=Piloderma croceum (strain F 1598) TaxID=765440 RepID=A0A0C3FA68_PILCF|nr:hypothetical protein PILCRDRAFT_12644 [Piloderma croceum F 1598]